MVTKPLRVSAISGMMGVLLALVIASPATADVAAPVDGSLTVTEPGTDTPITLTTNSPSPAMTFTAFGIGLSGFPNSDLHFATEIQVRPDWNTIWASNGWEPKDGCPTSSATATTTLSECGISTVYINGEQFIPSMKVYVEPSGSSISGTFIIKPASGNFFDAADSVGTVRVELAEGAWKKVGTIPSPAGYAMQVRSFNGSLQGKANTFTRSVVFDPNGATGNSYTQTWTKDATRALAANAFIREGYTFSKWTTERDGTGDSYLPGADYTFATNQTLYAQWTEMTDPESSPPSEENTEDSSPGRSSGVESVESELSEALSSGEEQLASTGSDGFLPAAFGLAMVASGMLLLATRRRLQ